MKLLFDENLSPAHAARLRAGGHDAVAALDAGLAGKDDGAVRRFAFLEKRTLVTLDSDFSHIVRFPPEGTPGVIWLRPSPPTEAAIQGLIDPALAQLAEVPIAGKLVIVEPGRIRIRWVGASWPRVPQSAIALHRIPHTALAGSAQGLTVRSGKPVPCRSLKPAD